MRFDQERFEQLSDQVASILKKTVIVLSLIMVLLQICHHCGFLERSTRLEGILYQREDLEEQLHMRLDASSSG